jgi:hypothetical protein
VPLLLLLLAAGGCVPRGLLAQAIRARGGALPGMVRTSEAHVVVGFPGTWRWRTVVAMPDRYAWSIETTGEPTQYLFDGRVVRSFVGSALTAADTSPTAAARSHARFMHVLLLDALRTPGVRLRELPPGELPSGAAAGLEAEFPDTGDRYLIGFDAARLVTSVEGPVLLPPFESRTVRVVLDDQRRVDGYTVPHHFRWTIGGQPLADERTLTACALRREPPAAAFAMPAALPRCP